jgi:hypothetical protein
MIRSVLSRASLPKDGPSRTTISGIRRKTVLTAAALALVFSAGLGLTTAQPAAAEAPIPPVLRDPDREPLILRRDLRLSDTITPVAFTTKTVYYTMIVDHSGAPVSNAVAMAVLPSGFVYQGFSASDGDAVSCLQAGPLVRCTIGAALSNANPAATVVVRATAPASPGQFTFSSSVDPFQAVAESNEGNNHATSTVTVVTP